MGLNAAVGQRSSQSKFQEPKVLVWLHQEPHVCSVLQADVDYVWKCWNGSELKTLTKKYKIFYGSIKHRSLHCQHSVPHQHKSLKKGSEIINLYNWLHKKYECCKKFDWNEKKS